MLGLGLVVLACDSPTTPPPVPQPAPAGQPAPPAPATVKALTINGPARIAPGETGTYEAIAQMTDGTTQVITSQTQWFTSNSSFLSIDSTTGLATARKAGDVTVSANYRASAHAARAVVVVPTGTYRLTGSVLESGLPVGGAVIKVVAGQGSGLSTTTDVWGAYKFFGVAGQVEIQATKPGYTSVSRSIDVSRDETMDIPDFTQPGAPPSLAGIYTLRITAADNCTASPPGAKLPDAARTRTYGATVTQDGPRLHVALSGADFLVQQGHGSSFDGRVEPSAVTFNLSSLGGSSYYYFYYYLGLPDLVEKISATDYFTMVGKAFTTSSAAGLIGPITGAATVFTKSPSGVNSTRMSCQSSQHQFSLTPQTAATRIRR